MGSLVLSALVVMVLIVVILRRAERGRRKLERRALDDLRRIYRRDNPRGQGLDPLIHDQQRTGVYPPPPERP